MKNILMIATYFPPMSGIGTVRITKYVKYLRKYNWEPTVITISDKLITSRDESFLQDIPPDVMVKRIELKKRHADISIDFYKAFQKRLQEIMEERKYEAVFVTGGPFFIIPIVKKIYKKYKIPYIIDLRDPWKLQKINNTSFFSMVKDKIKRILKGMLEEYCFRDAFTICTVNDTMTNNYKKEYPNYKDKFYTIPNGFDMDDYKKISEKHLSGFNIVYSGKFETSAGFRDPTNVFKAIYELNQEKQKINFIHIGKEEEKVRKIMEQENCQKYCKFLGFKTFQETIAFCKGADVLICIGGYEKIEQTGKIFDYIACEKPILVISTGESEMDVICEKFHNIYQSKHHELEKLKENIRQIYSKSLPYKKNDLETSEYSREQLTGKLSKILERIKNDRDVEASIKEIK